MGNAQLAARDILQPTIVLIVKVMMLRHVGIEIGPAGLDHDLAQKARAGELMERVVNGCKRDMDIGLGRFSVELLGRHVTVPIIEQQARQGEALAGWAETGAAQPL